MGQMELTIPLPVIGTVRTGHTDLADTPIQAAINRAEHGAIEIAQPYREGLDGLADFDYAWLHRPDEPRCGWFDELAIEEGTTPARLAP
jgi:tRNA (Thr-GGU) A37 N-methylase